MVHVVDQGIYSGGIAKGTFSVSKRGEDEDVSKNLVVVEGLNYLLGSALANQSSIGTWYVALFSGNVTPTSGWTASSFSSTANEFTNYSSNSRPQWSPGAVAAGALNSFSSKASFESTVNGAQVRGAAIISNSAKGGASGVLLAATLFPSLKTLDEGEILDVGYGFELLPG
jgi:hypothetical protein